MRAREALRAPKRNPVDLQATAVTVWQDVEPEFCMSAGLDMWKAAGALGLNVRKEKNEGFAGGMEHAIRIGLEHGEPDYVLCYNNDVEFDHESLRELILELRRTRALCAAPVTTFTKCLDQISESPRDRSPIFAGMVPAIVWLVPWNVCRHFKAFYGCHLFQEGLGRAWGEDDLAAYRLRKMMPKPFAIVPRAFVRHEGSVTSNTVPEQERMQSLQKHKDLMR